MAEAVFVELGLLDGFVDVAHADERQKWHHLFDRDEGIGLFHLAEDRLRRSGIFLPAAAANLAAS